MGSAVCEADVDVDVAVVGGGPAGAAAALTLVRGGLEVALVEGWRYQRPRLGETLSPLARPVLARLALAEAAEAASTPSFGNESAWGGPEPTSRPFLFGPYGAGWHLDRPRFDSLLAGAAAAAGARLSAGAPVTDCLPAREGSWRLVLGVGGRQREMTARGVIDATGRRAALACSLGARRLVRDRLVGIGVQYRGEAVEGGSTLVEATPEGWWYSAPLPPDRAVVMFMTDADLCRSHRYAERGAWEEALAGTADTRRRVSGFERLWRRPRVASAASQRLVRSGAPGRWLAAGDAAMGVDPLTGDGIRQALLTGEAAGLAMAHWLRGRPEPAHAYERWLDARFARYLVERRAYYALENRWPAAPFWRRRLEPASV
jgi:flavin-dependent dehydrogenase